MLNFNESIIEHLIDVPLDPAYTGVLESGMVMVSSANVGPNGEQLAKPSAGTAGEKVLGILKLSENSQATVPTIEILDIPASPGPFTVTLKELPVDISNIRAFNVTDGTDVTVVTAAPGAGEVQVALATGLITAHSGLAGKSIRFTYRFAITAQELARRGGRRSVNMGAERVYQQVTIARGDCKLLLSNFSVLQTDAKFTEGVNVHAGADGKVTTNTTGTLLGVCHQAPVLKLPPGVEQAFVGLTAKL